MVAGVDYKTATWDLVISTSAEFQCYRGVAGRADPAE